MESKVEDSLPLVRLFAPDKDLAVVACRGEDVAVLRVRPRNTPHCAFVTIPMIVRDVVALIGRNSPYPFNVSVSR